MTVSTVINPNTPYGLRVVTRLDGAVTSFRMRKYFIPQAQTNALFVGDPVVKIHAAADTNGIMAVDLATGGTTNRITGAIVGFLGTCTAGSGKTPSLWGLGGTGGMISRPATTALDYYALVCDDPEAQFLVQSSNNFGGVAGTAIPLSNIGLNACLVAGTGSTTSGLSGWQLDANTAPATTVGFQVNIIGFDVDPYNAALAQFQKIVVRNNISTETNALTGI